MTTAEKILVFRRGSLGDGVVSLPALHALAARFPAAEIRVLTNRPVSSQAAPMQSFLGPCGLVDDFFTFPPNGRTAATWMALGRAIRTWGPQTLVYLSEPSGRLGVLREAAFFAWCGVRRFIGLPLGGDLRTYRRLGSDRWEAESSRLLRAVGAASAPADAWDARFTAEEEAAAAALLGDRLDDGRAIALCIGGKGADKDWGDANWRTVLDAVTAANPGVGLVAVGAAEEGPRADRLAECWQGPVVNLCGRTEPRVLAQILRRTLFYLGHDCGTMHLAALVGTPCIAVFSAWVKPGVWFPNGDGHRVFYPWEAEPRVSATVGRRDGGATIQSILPGPVVEACVAALGRPDTRK